jgi:PQQ-dependent dehydrogenase (methanol/ethanol family)
MRTWVKVIVLAAAVAALAVSAAGAVGAASTNWLAWGNTPDQLRHSPLTQITKANVDQLARVYTVDFRAIDSSVRRGEQSYPLVIGNRIYMTTNDDNAWALDATTGKVIWRYKPENLAVFRNFGIVANRGLAYCGGRLFMATLDMHLVALRPSDGMLLDRVSVDSAVPGASSNYGYSQTSAPMCANGIVVMGAAGSEYGIRGFVMGWHTDLTPAWANPFWTIPPTQTEWRKRGRLVGGGVVWTPVTIDATTNTVYFGTGSATPLYFPQLRPGPAPRTDSLIAVDLHTGKLKWWQQQMSHNEWAYDTAQPPVVYTAKVGGKTRRIVSVATMEGVWFAYDAKTGAPIYQRVKVIDRIEHPTLKPGQPVAVFPGTIGGLNFSPASYDPTTNYLINAAAETGSVLVQQPLTPTQKKRKLIGDVFLGLANGDFGAPAPGWHDHGSISAIDVNTGKQVWKFDTPEPERGGPTTTATGVGFAGGGDGVLRAFDTKSGKILWTFKTGDPIASGPTIFSENGKEFVAITVGGTPTSSSGGTVTKLMVFSLGGTVSRALSSLEAVTTAPATAPAAAAPAKAAAPKYVAVRAQSDSPARIVTENLPYVRAWQATGSNTQVATGRLLLGTQPVQGARMRVDTYVLPQATDANGRFRYSADATVARRHPITVASLDKATVGGKKLTDAQQEAVQQVRGGFSVGYKLSAVHTSRVVGGKILVTGRVSGPNGSPPPPVVLYTYQLTGTITDSKGSPVAGAVVVTRTADRNFWTFSQPSDGNGNYISFFTASDQTGVDPVPLAVGVASGDTSYGGNVGQNENFALLKSASLNIQLPATATGTMKFSSATSYPGAIYDGLLVGVATGDTNATIKPVSARWPDTHGNFRLVLPASAAGKVVSFWMDDRTVFSAVPATPGGPAAPGLYPSSPRNQAPQGLLRIRLP